MAQRRNDSKRCEEDHEEYPIVKARTMLGELVNRAGYGSERIRLTRRGKVIAALVGVSDLAKLESVA
jgi:prevent-host-death family protein